MTLEIAASWPGDVRFALYQLVQRALPLVAQLPPPLGWAGSLEALVAFGTATPPAPAPSRYTELCARLALSPVEEMILIASMSSDLDVRMISLWQLLGHRIDAMRPRLQSLAQLATAAEVPELVTVLEPSHVLRALGLVALGDRGASAFDHTIEGHGVTAIAGDDASATALGVWRQPAIASTIDVPAILRGPLTEEIGRARSGTRSGGARPWAIWINGSEGSGRGQLAAELAAFVGRGTAWVVIEHERLDPTPQVAALFRVALTHQLVPCLEVAVPFEITNVLAAVSRIYRGPMIIIAIARATLPWPWHTIATTAFRPDAARRQELWDLAMPLASPSMKAELGHRFPLTAGGVFRAADEARARGGESDPHVLAQVSREQLESRTSLAERIRSTKRLTDLVAPPITLALIEEIIAFARNRRRVFDDWGFGSRMRGGLKVLMSGPPGTGKTLSSEIIASELDLDLYRIDLSNVVSKWIGETEKNLKQVFDQAESSGGVLLFDEADALFGKRTSDVKSSNDRYANLEVNYLLQRMEGYDGIVLLTTNLESGIDEAFRRRLNFRIRFLAPDVEERERLWKLMIPDGVPIAEALDFAEVADRYDMAGGNIKNAALRAAILAAAEGTKLTTQHLITAAEREFTEIGRIAK